MGLDDVQQLLINSGLSCCDETFKLHEIDGPTFSEITDEVLLFIGITNPVHKSKILGLSKTLK